MNSCSDTSGKEAGKALPKTFRILTGVGNETNEDAENKTPARTM